MKKKIVWAAVAGALTAGAAISVAQEQTEGTKAAEIRGDYRVVITQTCVRTPYQPPPASGFDPETKQLLRDGEMLTATGHGLLRFDADGTVRILDGAQTEVSLDLLTPGKNPVAPPANFVCDGSYKREGRKVSLSLSCNISVPQPGISVRVGPQKFEGYINEREDSLNLANIDGSIQMVTVSANGNPVQQRERVCTQHAVAIKPGE